MKVQQFIDWLVVNWQFVSSAAISIVTFILLLIFRKNKIKVFDPGLTNEILGYVISAENKFGCGHGKEKLEYVLMRYHEAHPGFASYIDWDDIVKSQVEYILTSPCKDD